MKTISTLALLILFIFNGFSQKGTFEIMPYGGISIPLGEYRNTGTGTIIEDTYSGPPFHLQLNGRGATNGLSVGLKVNYFILNRFNINIDYNRVIHHHEPHKKENFYKIELEKKYNWVDFVSYASDQKTTEDQSVLSIGFDYQVPIKQKTTFISFGAAIRWVVRNRFGTNGNNGFNNYRGKSFEEKITYNFEGYDYEPEWNKQKWQNGTLYDDVPFGQQTNTITQDILISRTYSTQFLYNLTLKQVLSNKISLNLIAQLNHSPLIIENETPVSYHSSHFSGPSSHGGLKKEHSYKNTFYTNINLGISYSIGGNKKTD